MMNFTEVMGMVLTDAQRETVESAFAAIFEALGISGEDAATEDVAKHYEPKDGERYFYMWGTGKQDSGVFSSENEKDLMRLAMGNYFKTEEQRDAAIEYLKIVAELKAFAFDHNAPINWDDHKERKYKLCWNRETGKVDTTWSRRKITDGIYFSSHDVAMAAVEAVGEDRIKKFYLPDAE